MSTVTLHNEKKKILVPQLRFQEFDGEFEQINFGKLYSFHTTNSLSRDKLNFENGNVYNIHYGDIHTKFETHFYLRNENVPLINEDVDLSKIKKESYCKNGDIIIADASEDYADIGKSIELIDIDNVKLLAGLHTFLARPTTEKTAIGFTSYLLKSWKLRKQIMTIAQGTKVLSLSTTRVSNLKLNLPTLPEQQKIASFLSSVDEKIQQLTRKVSLLEHYKKGVMQQLFSGKLRFKDENGKDYPDWEEKKLGEVFSFKQGVQCGVEDQFLEKTENLERFIRIIDLTSNTEVPRYINILDKNNILYEDDLFMVRYGVPGLVGYGYTGIIANNLFRLIPKNIMHNKFYYYVLTYLNKDIMNLSSSTTMPALNFGSLGILKIPSIDIKEQQKIANFLSSIDSKIEMVNEQLAQTQTFKKGLLQQLFV
jgi:type I restriction enzyme S subunit